MKYNHFDIPKWAWLFTSFGFMVFLFGAGWSITQASSYQIELAAYKLQVNHAINDVKAASDELEKTANTAPIAPKQKQKIKALTEEIDQATDSIDFEENN